MATLTPVTPAATGTAVTFAAASAGGDTIAVGAGNPKTTFVVRNASGSSITVTLAGAVACSQGGLHNTVVTCAVGDTDIVIPAATVTTAGNVAVTYSSTTSITVAAIYN